VNALDLGAVKRALNTTADLASPLDFNRDGRVNALDLGTVKAHLNRSLAAPTAATTALAPAPFTEAFSNNPVTNLTRAEDLRVWDARDPDLLG